LFYKTDLAWHTAVLPIEQQDHVAATAEQIMYSQTIDSSMNPCNLDQQKA
jgi:hypothetical protein